MCSLSQQRTALAVVSALWFAAMVMTALTALLGLLLAVAGVIDGAALFRMLVPEIIVLWQGKTISEVLASWKVTLQQWSVLEHPSERGNREGVTSQV